LLDTTIRLGDIGICSECTDLREEFAEELVDNAELDEKLDSICAETDPQKKAKLAAEFRQKLLAERWKHNPFREDQLTRSTVGDVEYIDVRQLGIKPYPPLTTEELKINGLID
jgi:hypothetical protein